MCLSDAKKRDIYDQHGTEDNFRQNYRQYFREEEQYDIFDFFDILNGGPMYNQRVRRRQQPRRHNAQGQENQNGFGQLLPILFVILFMVVANISGNISAGPSYSLTKTNEYKIGVISQTHNVEYFVDSATYETINENRRQRDSLESTLEEDYFRLKSRECSRKTENRAYYIRQAKYYTENSSRYSTNMKKADSIDLSACSIVQQMKETSQRNRRYNRRAYW